MAKDETESRTDINWILRDRKVIDGLDHLGIELVSVNLYQAMLPGITNVMECRCSRRDADNDQDNSRRFIMVGSVQRV